MRCHTAMCVVGGCLDRVAAATFLHWGKPWDVDNFRLADVQDVDDDCDACHHLCFKRCDTDEVVIAVLLNMTGRLLTADIIEVFVRTWRDFLLTGEISVVEVRFRVGFNS